MNAITTTNYSLVHILWQVCQLLAYIYMYMYESKSAKRA